MSSEEEQEKIKEAVRKAYGSIARQFSEEPEKARPGGCCGPAPQRVEAERQATAQASCCGPTPQRDQAERQRPAQASCCGPAAEPAEATGAARFYSAEELANLPDTVTDASLGCGNPLAIAELRPGEVVLDLGSGGGIDCFLAARKVGPEGQVIGLDMTPDMIRLARRNAKKLGAKNVDFRFGEMEDIPLPDKSVDVVISNCVINLSPDKDAVFRETYRVLRPGGRLSVSDIVVDGDLPQALRQRLDAWAGCVAGALDEADYLGKIRAAGFDPIEVVSRDYAEVREATDWEAAAQMFAPGEDGGVAAEWLKSLGLSPQDLVQKVASIKVRAVKPA